MLKELEERIISGGEISFSEAEGLLEISDQSTLEVLAVANRIRKHFQGDGVELCSIINAKSGKCTENCAFCAQSIHHQVYIQAYQLLDREVILNRAKLMEKEGAHRFALVISGRGVKEGSELDRLVDVIAVLAKEVKLGLCASLGLLTPQAADRLKEAGLSRYHHNVETARSFFPRICSTHTYEERVETIKTVRKLGMSVCSGVIVGMGESKKQRVEMAREIKDLGVDSVPINILNPIKGTPLGERAAPNPWEILKTVAVFRLIMPRTNLRFCGGREINLRDLQALGMLAGANGLMIGNYLTTTGREPKTDLQMLVDLGFSF